MDTLETRYVIHYVRSYGERKGKLKSMMHAYKNGKIVPINREYALYEARGLQGTPIAKLNVNLCDLITLKTK